MSSDYYHDHTELEWEIQKVKNLVNLLDNQLDRIENTIRSNRLEINKRIDQINQRVLSLERNLNEFSFDLKNELRSQSAIIKEQFVDFTELIKNIQKNFTIELKLIQRSMKDAEVSILDQQVTSTEKLQRGISELKEITDSTRNRAISLQEELALAISNQSKLADIQMEISSLIHEQQISLKEFSINDRYELNQLLVKLNELWLALNGLSIKIVNQRIDTTEG